jgi:hypothetical protein
MQEQPLLIDQTPRESLDDVFVPTINREMSGVPRQYGLLVFPRLTGVLLEAFGILGWVGLGVDLTSLFEAVFLESLSRKGMV